MEPLEINTKTNERRAFFKSFFEDLKQAFGELFNMEVIENYEDMEPSEAVNEAVKDTQKDNPELKDLENIQQVTDLTWKSVNGQAERMDAFKFETPKDGYNEIENKLGDITAEVSEKKAKEQISSREKGGNQKTRVDED